MNKKPDFGIPQESLEGLIEDLKEVRNKQADEHVDWANKKYGPFDFMPRTSGFHAGWDACLAYLVSKEKK